MAMLPKKTQVEPGLQAGALVVYENDGRPLVAAVLSYKNQKYQVLNQRGRETELPSFRLHLLPGRLPAQLANTTEKTKFIEDLAEKATEKAAKLNLEEIWTFVAAETRDFDTNELVNLYFGKDELESHLVLHLALLGDRIFFKRKEAKFAARNPEVVFDLKKSEQSRLERLRMQELLLATFHSRMKDASLPIPEELQHTTHLLLEVAAGVAELDNSKIKDAKELVDLCAEKFSLDLQGPRESRAFQLLERVHLIDRNSNLAFIRHRYPLRFSEEVSAAAKAAKTPQTLEDFPARERNIRRDLTTLDTFTVDDVSTRDMDDAISIEQTRDGFRLGIHISDVASLVTPGSILDRDAKLRATSLYAPERTVNMLPPELSENKLSLLVDQPRPALSCLIELDRNFQIIGTEIVPSLIKTRKRYTYDDVDEMLENPHSPLNSVYNIASSLEEARLSRGALRAGKREVQIVLEPSGDFRLVEIDENSAARSMIGEMMVLSNTILARFGMEHNLPLIFRGQDNPDPATKPPASVPEGPAADYAMRSTLKKSFTSVVAVRHSSLALDAYVQATSPIRRYADLINQRQILEMLFSGKALYTADECRKYIEDLETPLSMAQAITKETRRFWLLRALEKLSEKTSRFHGTVLRTDLKNPLVELHELVMPVLVKMQRPVKPGDEIEITLVKVDARSDYLRLEQAIS